MTREPHHAHLDEMRRAVFEADGFAMGASADRIWASRCPPSYDATAELLRLVRERAARREASRG